MPRQLFLLLSWLCLSPIAPAEESPGKILALSPKREALRDPGVPRLHEAVKEAVGKESGLRLAPGKPDEEAESAHDWLRDARGDRRFRLLAEVDGTLFDHAVLTVWNWDNEPIRQVRVETGNVRETEVRIDGLGSYLITLDGFADGVCRKRLVRNVGVTEDLNAARGAFRTDEFFLGVCAFPGRYHWMSEGEPVLPSGLTEQEARDLEAGLLARLGFQVVRVDESMEMGPANPEAASTAGPYRFDFERMDAAVAAYTSRGFELALQTMHAPDWAIHPAYAEVEEDRWRYPREESAQRAYVAALLERYGRHARFVQVFNEPDQMEFWAGSPAEYVEQFRYTHEQIRAWSPDIPVANGGYAFADEKRVRYFIERLRPWIDRPSYHSHGSLAGMREAFAKMKSLHREAGYRGPDSWPPDGRPPGGRPPEDRPPEDRPPAFLNTETGFDAWRLDQERRQAQALVQKTLYGWANDHRGVMLFCGRMVKGPGREQRDLGLLDYEFCPRFAYAAVGGLVSVLAGATFETTLMETEETCVYEFRRVRDRIVAAFSIGDEKAEIELRSDGRSVTVVDAMGNRAEPAAGDSLILSLDGYPGYAIFEGATSVSLHR